MSAVISDCGTYRYRLTRGPFDSRALCFVMLNPSTADAATDDPTIRRCIAFAAREGCPSITVCNAYALRATNPRELRSHRDPVGPHNHIHLDGIACAYDRIVVAWGATINEQREREVVGILRRYNARLLCLGKTKLGYPRHPLYVRGDQPLEDWP
jgi:hypothetical protein